MKYTMNYEYVYSFVLTESTVLQQNPNDDFVSDGANKSEDDASCDSDCPPVLNEMSVEQIRETMKKGWRDGLTFEEGNNVFFSICMERFERIFAKKQEYTVAQNVHTSEKKNPVSQIMTLETRFLSIVVTFMAYIVYCRYTNLSQDNLAVMYDTKKTPRINRGIFIHNLAFEMDQIQQNSEKSNCFTQIIQGMVDTYNKRNPHDKMPELYKDTSVMSGLDHLKKTLNGKLKQKNGNGHFSYDNYFQKKHHKGMLDEHFVLYRAMRLHYFILKDEQLI